jgi:hypothetical protein
MSEIDINALAMVAGEAFDRSPQLQEQYSGNKRAYVKYRQNSARGLIGVSGGRSPGAATPATEPQAIRTGAGMHSFTRADVARMRAAEATPTPGNPAVAGQAVAARAGAIMQSFTRADVAATRPADAAPPAAPKHVPPARSTAPQRTPAAALAPATATVGKTTQQDAERLAGMERNLRWLGVPLDADAVIEAGSPEACLVAMIKRARFDYSQGRPPYMDGGERKAWRILEQRKTGATDISDRVDRAIVARHGVDCVGAGVPRRVAQSAGYRQEVSAGMKAERRRQLACIDAAGPNHAQAIAHIRSGHEPAMRYGHKPQPAAA